ncbi:MAG TPA: hypothetical protein VK617_11610 [Gemmatimonadaceae bacterium]|jgi:hypothetical protein|nr:hypothetical protein [Gemmatimonadaceae bacterium]
MKNTAPAMHSAAQKEFAHMVTAPAIAKDSDSRRRVNVLDLGAT